MRKTYFSICKCRLCGETYTAGQTRCTIPEAAVLAFEAYKGPNLHYCKDDSIGIADFLGFKFQEETQCSN